MMVSFFAFQTFPAADVSWALVLPELIIGIAAIVVMMVDAFAKASQRWISGTVSLIGLTIAGAACYMEWPAAGNAAQTAFNGMIVLDHLRMGFTFIFLIVSALTV